MSEEAGLVNVYVCELCGKPTITKNRDEGTTPFMLVCRATSGCGGLAISSFYRVPQNLTPMIVFIKPSDEELKTFLAKHPDHVAAIRDHVSRGGLLDVEAAAARVH
jgi:hypothetical protein